MFDTGIGKEGYSIIGQGQIDKILSGKPEERRELLMRRQESLNIREEKLLHKKILKRKSIILKELKIFSPR